MVDEIRPFWLPEIHRVSGDPQQTLIGLFGSQNYQIHSPQTPQSVNLAFQDWSVVASAFARDSSQASMAAVESIDAARAKGRFAKGVGWLLIKTYYAGFFAAQAIHRMLAKSVVQIDGPAANAIDEVADLFGMKSSGSLERGLFYASADRQSRTLQLTKIPGTGGSHVALWSHTVEILRGLVQNILLNSSSSSAATVAGQLSDLDRALSEAGANAKGSWLSVIRNRVNYQQSFGTWFPYSGQATYCKDLAAKLSLWLDDPDVISISQAPDRELQRFVEASTLLVSLCRSLAIDMNSRCPVGNSFQHYTTVRLLRQLELD